MANKKSAAGTKRKAAGARAGDPALPLSRAEATKALGKETRFLKALKTGTARNDWQIGRRLNQIAELELHVAAGFTTIQDYAERAAGIASSKTFSCMRVAEAFSEEAAAAFGIDKLEQGLVYIGRTPEDEKPKDVPKLMVRIPVDGGDVVEKPFAETTFRELRAASKNEGELHPKGKKRPVAPEVAAHQAALARAAHVLHRALGAHVAPHASVSGRSVDGVIVIDIRGVPLVDAAKALAAISTALAPVSATGVRTSGPRVAKRTKSQAKPNKATNRRRSK